MYWELEVVDLCFPDYLDILVNLCPNFLLIELKLKLVFQKVDSIHKRGGMTERFFCSFQLSSNICIFLQ
jgi:hypothetical protein